MLWTPKIKSSSVELGWRKSQWQISQNIKKNYLHGWMPPKVTDKSKPVVIYIYRYVLSWELGADACLSGMSPPGKPVLLRAPWEGNVCLQGGAGLWRMAAENIPPLLWESKVSPITRLTYFVLFLDFFRFRLHSTGHTRDTGGEGGEWHAKQ